MFLEIIREHTRPHHQAIERNRLLAEVLRPTLTREVYVTVLARFYGFMKPLEDTWRQYEHGTGLGALLAARTKTGLLEQDLAHMGVPMDTLQRLPVCTDLPSCDAPSRCLGILYVTEGSTLGGQIIAAAVKRSLGIDGASGAAYFTGYAASTRPMWQETCRALEEYGQGSDAKRDDVVAAATETFEALHQWFQGA